MSLAPPSVPTFTAADREATRLERWVRGDRNIDWSSREDRSGWVRVRIGLGILGNCQADVRTVTGTPASLLVKVLKWAYQRGRAFPLQTIPVAGLRFGD